MRKFLLLFLVFNLLLPVYAQVKLGPAAKRIFEGKLLNRPGVSYLSYRTNADFYRQIEHAVSEKITFPTTDLTPGHPFRSTFQLQHTDSPLELTGSGFAVDLFNDGKIYGVAAGHVARRLSRRVRKHPRTPHIRVQTGPHAFIIAPIEKFFIGNPESMDVALFEIPPEVLPYIDVLRPAQQAPTVGQEVTIQGFLEGQSQPFTLPRQQIMFTSPLRLFLQKTPLEDMRGFCGAPGLTDGRVSMVYIGFDSARAMVYYDWFNKLSSKAQFSMSNLHYAVPIDIVKLVAKSMEENAAAAEAGITMKVLGHPVALLRPNDSVVSITQFRNGEEITTLESYRHTAVDPEKLERFFELQENDILRISIAVSSPEHPYPAVSVIYDVNVSTGEVTKLSE